MESGLSYASCSYRFRPFLTARREETLGAARRLAASAEFRPGRRSGARGGLWLLHRRGRRPRLRTISTSGTIFVS